MRAQVTLPGGAATSPPITILILAPSPDTGVAARNGQGGHAVGAPGVVAGALSVLAEMTLAAVKQRAAGFGITR